MDTKLHIELTEKQVTNLSSLKTEVIKGFGYWHDEKDCVVVSTRELTPQELSDLSAALVALPDTYSQEYVRGKFDLVLFQTDLAALLPSLSSPNLRWEFAALNAYATNRDFEGMAGYMDMLVASGAAKQSDDDSVIDLLLKQGVVV